MKTRSPWFWVPTLYFAEGLPYFIVNTISVVIFKDLGMDNSRLALLTSLIGLPWLVKPLWSPFVDIFKSPLHLDPDPVRHRRLCIGLARYFRGRLLHDRP